MRIKPCIQFAVLIAGLSVAVLSFAGAGTRTAAADDDPRLVLIAAVEKFIRPGYARFDNQAEQMQASADRLCAAPSPAALDAARRKFAELVEAWSRIEIVRFGPVVDDNRLERIFFFPDRRGIGLRQLRRVLAEKDSSALDPETLAAKSVALQGLVTLEYLLHGKDAESLAAGAAFRCGFAKAVTARIHATAAELEAAWNDPQGIARRLSDPRPEYPDFRTPEEGLQALLGVFINSSELIADTRLAPFIGEDAAHAHPKTAPLWRSSLTDRALMANLDGLQSLYKTSGIGGLVPAGARRFGRSAMFELDRARQTLEDLERPLDKAAADPQRHGSANYLLIVLHSVRDTFAGRIAVGLGLSAGFSSLDGD